MSDINISIPGGEKKRLLTGGKYCPDDIVVEVVGGDTDAAFEAGRKAEYDAFWGAYLNGDNTGYQMRFAGCGWNDNTFNPNIDIIPLYGSAERIFCFSNITDIEAALKRSNVILDLSRCSRLDYAFYYCVNLTCVPEIVIGNSCVQIQGMFSQCKVLRTIRKLTFPEKTFNTIYFFEGCLALEEITIGGTIACDGLDLHWSTKLNKASITSFINALSATTSGFSITFSETAVNTAFETSSGTNDGAESAEWLALIATKPNWTIKLIDS